MKNMIRKLAPITAIFAISSFAHAEQTVFSSQEELDAYVQDVFSTAQSTSADDARVKILTEPDWFDGADHTFFYSIPKSISNFDKYYGKAKARYGSLPPFRHLAATSSSWVLNIATFQGFDLFTNNPPLVFGLENRKNPHIPLVNREVTQYSHKTGFRKPFMPPIRWTRDGRVAVVGDTGGTMSEVQPLRVRLNRPELLTEHFLQSPAGVPSVDLPVEIEYEQWGLPGTRASQHVTICEAKPKTPAEANPYACGPGGADDCYDLTLVAGSLERAVDTQDIATTLLPVFEESERLYSRKMMVRVENPKTKDARIAEVTFDSEYKVAPIQQGVMFEIITPADGRLVVARRVNLPLVWKHSTTGQMKVGNYDTVYAVADESAEPCDASTFGDLKPISHAPYDPAVKSRYLFAAYPYRDPMGNLITDGEELKGTYPWIDMDAQVVTVQIGEQNLFHPLFGGRFPTRCVEAGCEMRDADYSNDTIYAVMGGWTKGKMVAFDNMLNNADFRIDSTNALYLDIYRGYTALPSTENKSDEVLVGGTRALLSTDPEGVRIPLFDAEGRPLLDDQGNPKTELIKNSSSFDTIDHRLNYNPHFTKSMPQDVVWLLSSGFATDEFAFDDHLNDNAFIISNMQTAYGWNNASPYRMTAYDGYIKALGQFLGEVRIQNSATTLPYVWKVPSYGEVLNGRVEPVANGGVKGKGLYFNGEDTRIRYKIDDQPQSMSDKYWYHSLFVDARDLNFSSERILMEFPDASRLTISRAPAISRDGSEYDSGYVRLRVYNNYGERQDTITVPTSLVIEKWFNIGIQVAPKGRGATLFVNGFPYRDVRIEDDGGSVFRMQSGHIALGRQNAGYDLRYNSFWDEVFGNPTMTDVDYKRFSGWMDEYKVFSYKPDLETACNLANGTLVAPINNPALAQVASLYSPVMHDRVSAHLRVRGESSYPRYVCHTGELGGQMASLADIPAGTVSLRDAIHFPEGPLYRDQPRPDSSANPFCLSCHSRDGVGGLTVDALTYRPVPARIDPRRQPSQPPQYITGVITNEFMASANADFSSFGSNYIDDYILALSPRGYVPTSYPDTSSQTLSKTGYSGGSGGNRYDDSDYPPEGGFAYVDAVSIRTGSRVDAVKMTVVTGLEERLNLEHGGSGGSSKTLVLSPGEYISSVEVHAGWHKTGWWSKSYRIHYIRFNTNLGRSLSGGTQTSDRRVYTAPAGHQIVATYGRSDSEIERIGFIMVPLTL